MIVLNVGSAGIFWDSEYGFSTMGVGTILGNGRGIHGQNYVHYRNWFLRI